MSTVRTLGGRVRTLVRRGTDASGRRKRDSCRAGRTHGPRPRVPDPGCPGSRVWPERVPRGDGPVTISQTTATPLPGVQVHRAPVRPAETSGETQNDAPGRNMTQAPRRMIAVTVALSEPADCAELDWADTISANLRLIYRNTTVQIIDTWRVDQ